MINQKSLLIIVVLASSLAIAQNAITQSETALDSDTESEFDALFGDDDAGGDSGASEIAIFEDADTDVSDDTESEDFEDPRLPAEDRAGAGGWYLDEYQIRYRPAVHSDQFIKSWVDVSTSQNTEMYTAILDDISDDTAPGACFKCHSIDKVGESTNVNWKVRQSDPNIHEFNKFSHVAHFNLLDEDGCATCHTFDKDSDFASGFEDQNPMTFASNFQSISEQTCAQCHQEDKVGDSCQTCHNYHIGKFDPTIANENEMSTGE